MCSELLKENIIFPEYMVYRVFKLKMLSHMLEDGYFDFKNKNWHTFVYERYKFGDTFDEEINHFEDDDGYDLFVPIKLKE